MEQYEIFQTFGIRRDIYEIVEDHVRRISPYFPEIEEIRDHNTLKVLHAMQENRLSSIDFQWNSGYGYGDSGREKIETIYADVFCAEDAIVRPSIASGTHAIYATLDALLQPGDRLLSICGHPYDTMQKAIGIVGDQKGTLLERGVSYGKVDLIENAFDFEGIRRALETKTKLILIQRSCGYTLRSAISMEQMEEVAKYIRRWDPNVILMVDNCYGEFTEKREPIEAGIDICVGSLIKNPGGAIALSGGYVVGRQELIERVTNRLTAPGLGKDIGLTFGTNRPTLQGLYFAPHVVAEARKSALLFASIFSKMGYPVVPNTKETRSDIIQAIVFEDREKVVEFCRGIQSSSTVDSHVVPHAWDMPGYEDHVVMASGGFVEGSSIEMSADGPIRKPYSVFYQGGVSFQQTKLAAMRVLENFESKGFVDLTLFQE